MSDTNPDDRQSPPDPTDDATPDDQDEPSQSASTPEQALTPREQAALQRVRLLSRLLDDAVRVPGTNFRVGIDPIVGILPVAGDAVTTAISLYPIVEAYRFGVSRATLIKMLLVVAIDATVGSIPLIGPVFDAFWKANTWNLGTLEQHIKST